MQLTDCIVATYVKGTIHLSTFVVPLSLWALYICDTVHRAGEYPLVLVKLLLSVYLWIKSFGIQYCCTKASILQQFHRAMCIQHLGLLLDPMSFHMVLWTDLQGFFFLQSSVCLTGDSSFLDSAVRMSLNLSWRSAWFTPAPLLPQRRRNWNSVFRISSMSSLGQKSKGEKNIQN